MFSLILGKTYAFLVGRYYVDTIKLVLTFEKKRRNGRSSRSYTHPKVVTDIVRSDLLDKIALEMRFLGVPSTREISLT